MATPPVVTLLTDFGLADHYVAAMKGVILSICPEARLIDISHEVRPYGIREAAFVLGQAYPCFPAGMTTHVVVVDPGVGSERRPLVVEADGHRFVGPDNGVLSFAVWRDLGFHAWRIEAEERFRQPVSATFHGRDIFAPIAGHLAAGMEVAEVGGRVQELVRLDMRSPVRDRDGVWRGRILYQDRFGNVVTSFRRPEVPEIACKRFEMRLGQLTINQYRSIYAGAADGEAFVIEGSSGYLEVSMNQGDAAEVANSAVGGDVFLQFSLT